MQRQRALAGRRPELGRVRDVLAGASDTGALLVLADPGIGKSQLVRVACDAAGDDNSVVVLAGACLRLTEQLPLLPIVTALRSACQRDRGAWMRAALDACPDYVRSALTAVLPELQRAEDAPVPFAPGDPWWRQRLFTAIGATLAALGRIQMAALVIEDLQWADTSTLDLLDYLLVPAPDADVIPVVLTARHEEPDTARNNRDWLSRICTRPGVDVVRLQALSLEETAEQVALLIGHRPGDELVADVFARSEGNALFTEQLVGQADLPSGAPLPQDLQALFDAKLAKLGSTAEQVARALAIAGRPVSADMISILTGLAESEVLNALHELHEQRLLRAETANCHTLRHALLADAVAEHMLASERASGHRRAAELLTTVDGGAAEIAEHWQRAHDAAQELRWRVLAADAASSTHAPAQASAHWLRVLDLWDSVDDPEAITGRGRGEACLSTADNLGRAGLPLDAWNVLESALAQPWAVTEPGIRAELLVRAAEYRSTRDGADALRTSTEALALFEKADPTTSTVEALEQHARMLVEQGQIAAGAAVIAHALEVSEQLPGRPLHRVLQVRGAWCSMAEGDATRALQLLDRAWQPEFDTSDHRVDLNAATGQTDLLLKLGRFRDVPPAATRALEPLQRLNLPDGIGSAVVRANAAEALIALGRPAEASRYLIPLSGRSDVGHLIVDHLLAELDVLNGDLDGAVRRFDSLDVPAEATIEKRLEVGTRHAELELWCNRPEAALQSLLPILAAAATTDLSRFTGWMLAAAARAAADISGTRLGEQRDELAQALLADLSGLHAAMQIDPLDQATVPATSQACAATWHAELGRLRAHDGDADWDIAARAWEDLQMVHRAAYCRWRQAEALLTIRGHRDHVRELLRTADHLAANHRPLQAAIRATATRARIAMSDATISDLAITRSRDPVHLTDREHAVLRLLAEGKTNNDIGKELFISPKTVSVHVTSILRKLGVQSRVHAATIAERTGLLADQ